MIWLEGVLYLSKIQGYTGGCLIASQNNSSTNLVSSWAACLPAVPEYHGSICHSGATEVVENVVTVFSVMCLISCVVQEKRGGSGSFGIIGGHALYTLTVIISGR